MRHRVQFIYRGFAIKILEVLAASDTFERFFYGDFFCNN